MEAFLVSTSIVALAEMGDKTQLLALVLAARFRKPWPIVWGIFVATVFNHALAGAAGAWITTLIGPQMLRWVLGVSFIAMAVWMLIPDKLEDGDTGEGPRWGVFGTTVVAFFLAEMGDKTQIATVMLAAQYSGWLWVVAHSARDLTIPLVLLTTGNVVIASALWQMWDFPDRYGSRLQPDRPPQAVASRNGKICALCVTCRECRQNPEAICDLCRRCRVCRQAEACGEWSGKGQFLC